MQRTSFRRDKQDNQNNKRWSTPFLDQQNQQESISSQSSDLTLLTNQLGIPKDKAERACVATGFRSAPLAIDWLLQRKDIHKPIRTEFIVLLCPDQRLIEQIQTFTNETFRQWPKEFLQKDRPHLRAYKLSNFFHIPDQSVYALHKVFDSVVNRYHSTMKQMLKIVLHMNNDYLMLIPDTESKKTMETIFELIKQEFEQIVPNVSVFPAKRLAHLTLTNGLSSLFNLSTHQRTSLIQLARIYLDLDRSINWNLRLYSREQTPLDQVVYRVVSSTREATLNNCLSLKANDLFMVLDNSRISEEENVFGE